MRRPAPPRHRSDHPRPPAHPSGDARSLVHDVVRDGLDHGRVAAIVAVAGVDVVQEPLDRLDGVHGAEAREDLECVLGTAQLGVDDRVPGPLPQGSETNLRAIPTGTSTSLSPWITNMGGASSVMRSIGEYADH